MIRRVAYALVLVQNERRRARARHRLFSGRGYNSKSSGLGDSKAIDIFPLITIVTTCTPMVIEQIQISSTHGSGLPGCRHTLTGRSIERELAMVRGSLPGDHRVESLRLAAAFRARVDRRQRTGKVLYSNHTGNSPRINQFHRPEASGGLVEVSPPGSRRDRAGLEGCRILRATGIFCSYPAGGGLAWIPPSPRFLRTGMDDSRHPRPRRADQCWFLPARAVPSPISLRQRCAGRRGGADGRLRSMRSTFRRDAGARQNPGARSQYRCEPIRRAAEFYVPAEFL